MPVTSKIKGYPFEWILEISKIKDAVLCDQVRSLDWKARKAHYIATLTKPQTLEIIEKFSLLLE